MEIKFSSGNVLEWGILYSIVFVGEREIKLLV